MSVRKAEITRPVESVIGINCDKCGADIPRVFPDHPQAWAQGMRMLHVDISGGYGEYMDGGGTVHLCEKCADELKSIYPLFAKVIDGSYIGSCDWREVGETNQPQAEVSGRDPEAP